MKIRLKAFRESQKKLWQSDIASLLNVHQATISKMEREPVNEIKEQQYRALCERFGEEVVAPFLGEEQDIRFGEEVVAPNIGEGQEINVTGNTLKDSVVQNNGVVNSTTDLDIIRMQSKAIVEIAKKQTEQTDRLLSILEKISDKL